MWSKFWIENSVLDTPICPHGFGEDWWEPILQSQIRWKWSIWSILAPVNTGWYDDIGDTSTKIKASRCAKLKNKQVWQINEHHILRSQSICRTFGAQQQLAGCKRGGVLHWGNTASTRNHQKSDVDLVHVRGSFTLSAAHLALEERCGTVWSVLSDNGATMRSNLSKL